MIRERHLEYNQCQIKNTILYINDQQAAKMQKKQLRDTRNTTYDCNLNLEEETFQSKDIENNKNNKLCFRKNIILKKQTKAQL